jgi:hypothetical protein
MKNQHFGRNVLQAAKTVNTICVEKTNTFVRNVGQAAKS